MARYRIMVTHESTFIADGAEMCAEFPAEWLEARGRGLDEAAFVRESAELMLPLEHRPPMMNHVPRESYFEVVVDEITEGT